MNFLEFAVWGAYLTSMGSYIASIGYARNIAWFYSVQGFVSLCMPALMGIIADRWIPAQRLLSLCHFLAGIFMTLTGFYGLLMGGSVEISIFFLCYTLGVVFFMPTLSLANAVAYSALDGARMDTVKTFTSVRMYGTIGFICAMWAVDLMGLQRSALQFSFAGMLALLLSAYALTLPSCPTNRASSKRTFSDAFGLRAFALFRQRRMAVFFVFSVLVGICLQITNGFASPYLFSFGKMPEFADAFGVRHANILISISQFSETFCILLIPYFLNRFGIKRVILIAISAWALRFAFFAVGNPGNGVWLFVLSMLMYGVAFDFFNIAGSLFVNKEADVSVRSSAQGLFLMMTSGLGTTIGTLTAQAIINSHVYNLPSGTSPRVVMSGWADSWMIFACYALTVGLFFALCFKEKNECKIETV